MHKALNDKPLTEDDITMIMSKSAKLVEKLEDINAILQAKIKKQPGATSSTSFSVSITGSTGEVTISLTDTQTAALTSGRYYYDVFLTSGGGVVSRMVEGQAFVTAGISTGVG